MIQPDSKVTLVTGANGALGSALVASLTDRGHRVVGLERLRAAERPRLEARGETTRRLLANTADESALREALALAETELGPLTGAVLAAGAWRGGHRLAEGDSAADFRAVMEANLDSANLALRALLPGMVARASGSVVLIGSRSGVRPYSAPGDAAYAASKAAVLALAQSAAAEVLSAGVRVNVVLPSTIDTEANRRAMPDADAARWVTTESLADVIAFLLSEQARDISGAAIPVYGRTGV